MRASENAVAFYLHIHLPKNQMKSFAIAISLRVDGLEKMIDPRLFDVEAEDDLARFF